MQSLPGFRVLRKKSRSGGRAFIGTQARRSVSRLDVLWVDRRGTRTHHVPMLGLRPTPPPWWLDELASHLPVLLVDHAHCEKKAAGTAINLIFAYVDRAELVHTLAGIAREELEHFQQVLDILRARDIGFVRQRPSAYGRRLHELVRTQEPERLADRCLVGAMIEARSCDRFQLLVEHTNDPELATFFRNLLADEARHHTLYSDLARSFIGASAAKNRLEELLDAEAEIIRIGDTVPRLHG